MELITTANPSRISIRIQDTEKEIDIDIVMSGTIDYELSCLKDVLITVNNPRTRYQRRRGHKYYLSVSESLCEIPQDNLQEIVKKIFKLQKKYFEQNELVLIHDCKKILCQHLKLK